MAGMPATPLSKALGAWLTDYRLHFELSQYDVALVMNEMGPHRWTQPIVSKIERGLRSLTIEEVLDLAKWAGASVEHLIAKAGEYQEDVR